ncbi:hypothetical protein FACS1894190_15640 [Spirochaetia bacterium]|nr:hypothetical protein FACS1894190_15640 [Spirochaetia bacterium]
MENPKVSIIVPVYNVEKYFARCMESIAAQTFNNFECILVDDASTDVSPALCDERAKKDTRIKVIHNSENKGASISRKIGLDSANGNYILFIDSDDWVEPDMIDNLYTKAIDGNFDVVCYDFWWDNIGRSTYINQDILGMDKTTLIKYIIDTDSVLMGQLWTKLYSRTILTRVQFPTASHFEERVINVQVVSYAQKIGYIHKALYHYCYNPQSICNEENKELTRQTETCSNYKIIVSFLHDTYKDLNLFEPELSNIINRMKFRFILNKTTRTKNLMLEFCPESNKYIFRSIFIGSSSVKKLFLWLASKGILLPFKLLDIIKHIK